MEKKKASHSPQCDRVLTSFSEPLYETGNCKALSITNLQVGVDQGQPSGLKGFSAGIRSTKVSWIIVQPKPKAPWFIVQPKPKASWFKIQMLLL